MPIALIHFVRRGFFRNAITAVYFVFIIHAAHGQSLASIYHPAGFILASGTEHYSQTQTGSCDSPLDTVEDLPLGGSSPWYPLSFPQLVRTAGSFNATIYPVVQNRIWVPGSASGIWVSAETDGSTIDESATWNAAGIYQYSQVRTLSSPTYSYTQVLHGFFDLNTGAWSGSGHLVQIETFQLVGGGTCTTTTTANGEDEAVFAVSLLKIGGGPVLSAVNPLAPYTSPPSAVGIVDVPSVLSAPGTVAVAADGNSAAVLLYMSASIGPVTFSIQSSSPAGSLGRWTPDYLQNPSPPAVPTQSVTVSSPISGPDANGNYVFLALLWGPNQMPTPNTTTASLSVITQQEGQTAPPAVPLSIVPSPLMLVHGVWSNATEAGFSPGSGGFYDWIAPQYPRGQVYPVNYGIVQNLVQLNSLDFADPNIQAILATRMLDALKGAADAGISARTVDVVAHSMGGLITRYFLRDPSLFPFYELLANPVHQLITIGTPHEGSAMADLLYRNKNNLLIPGIPMVDRLCSVLVTCDLGSLMALTGKVVGPGVASMVPGSNSLRNLSNIQPFKAIAGDGRPSPLKLIPLSFSEAVLDLMMAAFVPGNTVASVLSDPAGNDTIVANSSQIPGIPGSTVAADSATLLDLVHTNICAGDLGCPDLGETASQQVWQQAFFWLTGGTTVASQQAPTARSSNSQAAAPSGSLPILDLTGYTAVPASNVTFAPTNGAVFTANSNNTITATSSTKTISQVLLSQTVSDPTDTPFLYTTSAPFTISYTPRRLGSLNFSAITLFSDKTYSVSPLQFGVQAGGDLLRLEFANPSQANWTVGDSRVVQIHAVYLAGSVDVTGTAIFSVKSGGTAVLQLGAGGVVTANGNGIETLTASYGGLSSSLTVGVGPCTYGLGAVSGFISNAGGTVTVPVVTPAQCAWTATTDASWLTADNLQGTGNGGIGFTAPPNTTGATRIALVRLGPASAVITQPAVACTYNLSASFISAPGAGTTGNLTVSTTCPVVFSSSASWISLYNLGSSVDYAIAPNSTQIFRTGTITIGNKTVTVSQPPGPALRVLLSHTGNFAQGQTGAQYTVQVSNTASGATAGAVTLTEAAPAGMTVVAISGTNWNCTTLPTCTISAPLNGGRAYPPVTVTVNINANAASSLINTVNLSGGGSNPATANDPTTITHAAGCDLNQDGVLDVTDVQGLLNEILGLAPGSHDLNLDGLLNVVDIQVLINAVLGQGCAAG